jgi:hypothetical protein
MNRMRMKMKVIWGLCEQASIALSTCHTFIPYCSFAIIGLSDMKVNNLRRHVNGRGTISAMKMIISATKRKKTCRQNKSKQVGNILACDECGRLGCNGEGHNGQPMATAVSQKALGIHGINIRDCNRGSWLLRGSMITTSCMIVGGVCWYGNPSEAHEEGLSKVLYVKIEQGPWWITVLLWVR